MKNEIEKQICPFCGVEFIPQRSNQIFTNSDCRISYNNQKNNEKRKQLSFINKPLLKNHQILSEILGNEREKIVHKEYLRGAGFSFKVFTNLHKDENINKYYYSVYKFYYFKIDDDHYKIINNG